MSQAANLPGLELKTTESLAFVVNNIPVQNYVNNFLTEITQANWDLMDAALKVAIPAVLQPSGIRLLITVADGAVAYDSSRPTRNTWQNFVDRAINDNHNTRPEILQALLATSGVGSANRYSTSVRKVDLNLATRFGLSVTYPLGCYRLSQSA
jgi:hypothetical protein